MANIALNKPSGGQLILSPEDGTSTETVTIPSGGVMAADTPTGKILQIQQSVKVDNSTFSLSNTWQASGLSVSITPTSASSKILVMYTLQFGDNGQTAYPGGRLMRNGSVLSGAIATDSVNKQGTSAGGWTGSSSMVQVTGTQYVDSPATTSTLTYSVDVTGYGGRTFYINHNHGNDANHVAGISTITVMEVAA